MEKSAEQSLRPSTSKQTLNEEENAHLNNSQDCDTLPPTPKDEEDEIARLEKERNVNTNATTDQADCEARIKFLCSSCGLSECVHYFGKTPDFATGIKFFEDTFVMRDPFKPTLAHWKSKPESFIAIGGRCSECDDSVCHDAECSFFYTRTFCLRCAEKQLKSLPPEAQLKLRRQLQTKQTK